MTKTFKRITALILSMIMLISVIPMSAFAAEIRKTGVIHSEEYISDGLLLDATVEIYTLEKYKEFILEEWM